MQVKATTTAALDTDADTIVIGVFDGERVAHDLADGTLQALLDSGEARTTFKHVAVAHGGNRRVVLAGLGSTASAPGSRRRSRCAAPASSARARCAGRCHTTWKTT